MKVDMPLNKETNETYSYLDGECKYYNSIYFCSVKEN